MFSSFFRQSGHSRQRPAAEEFERSAATGRDVRDAILDARLFHGGQYRRMRYKEVGQVLWRRGSRRRPLRLFVLAPTPYRNTKAGRRYYREKAFLLCDDNRLAAKALLQAYLGRRKDSFVNE